MYYSFGYHTFQLSRSDPLGSSLTFIFTSYKQIQLYYIIMLQRLKVPIYSKLLVQLFL